MQIVYRPLSNAGLELASAMPESVSHWPRRQRQLLDLLRLMRLHRPVGIWLLLWPTLWALWMASNGLPSGHLLLIFVVGTVLMRSAGCIANDLADRNIDPQVKRTRDRPLAARRLSPYSALWLLLALLTLALLLVWQLNTATIRLAFIGAALTISYPFFKRFFPVPQLYLGLCFGWAVPMAFAAVLGHVPRTGWVLLLAAVLWAGVYDTFYAMVDREDDRRIGIHSSALSFGDMDLTIIAAMQVMVVLSLVLVGHSLEMGARYYAGLGLAALLFAYQLWTARRRDRSGCFQAFEYNNYFGIAVLLGVVWQFAHR
jgi:4-hydroxybenzoate polyprenyltransferase